MRDWESFRCRLSKWVGSHSVAKSDWNGQSGSEVNLFPICHASAFIASWHGRVIPSFIWYLANGQHESLEAVYYLIAKIILLWNSGGPWQFWPKQKEVILKPARRQKQPRCDQKSWTKPKDVISEIDWEFFAWRLKCWFFKKRKPKRLAKNRKDPFRLTTSMKRYLHYKNKIGSLRPDSVPCQKIGALSHNSVVLQHCKGHAQTEQPLVTPEWPPQQP